MIAYSFQLCYLIYSQDTFCHYIIICMYLQITLCGHFGLIHMLHFHLVKTCKFMLYLSTWALIWSCIFKIKNSIFFKVITTASKNLLTILYLFGTSIALSFLYTVWNCKMLKKLEGAQRVHISAKYTIMLWGHTRWVTRWVMYTSTHLHTRLHSNVCGSRFLPMIMTSSIMTACCGVTGVCGESFGNGVKHFCTFFSTPISILNLTMSSESQENDVSNDILFKQKYSQLFTHESNTLLSKQLYQANRFTDSAQQWRDLNNGAIWWITITLIGISSILW